MKNWFGYIFLVVLCISSCGHPKPFMDYVISWKGDGGILEVELSYSTINKDSTVFIFGDPSFGGQIDIFQVIQNIRTTEPEELKIDEDSRQITVYHNGAKTHKLTYEIDGSISSNIPTTSSQTELFRPIITPKVLTLVTKQFTLEITDDSNPLVSFRWDKFPKNIVYFNSIDPTKNNPVEKISDYYKNVQMVLFVMGDNISIKKYNVMEIPYYSVTTLDDKYGNDLQHSLAPFFEAYFQSIHRFWNDKEFPFYFLAVTALQNNRFEIGGGGFGLKNGFVMKLGREFGTREKYVTAHETAHSWIGVKITLGERSFDHQWFGEGFNDYTTIINLANSKIFDQEEFLHYLNEENFRQHYESDINNVHNDSIEANFWLDYANYGKLPYRRGLIFAFYLDNQIRLASDGKFTLRNMLLDIHQLIKSKKDKDNLTLDDFISVGSNYLDKTELEKQVQLYMIEGQPIDFSQVILIDEFKIEINNNIPSVKLTDSADLLKIYQW